jgi:hypothetical protein
VDTRVQITMRPDGTGVVHVSVALDADAINQVGGITAASKQVPLSDLKAAGWQVSAWTPSAGGGATITFAHPYRGQADLDARLVDLVGKDGILRDARIIHDRGWFRSGDGLSVVVDMRAPATGIGSDRDLKARLAAYGVDPASVDAQLTHQLRQALHVSVVVQLPDGSTKEFAATNGTRSTFRAANDSLDWDQVVKVGIAVALAFLAGLFLLAASASSRRDRRRRAERISITGEHERAPLM